MSISSHPVAPLYSALWYELMGKRGIGPVKCTRFMFTGNERLGGKSPVQAIRAGHAEDVRKLIGAM